MIFRKTMYKQGKPIASIFTMYDVIDDSAVEICSVHVTVSGFTVHSKANMNIDQMIMFREVLAYATEDMNYISTGIRFSFYDDLQNETEINL